MGYQGEQPTHRTRFSLIAHNLGPNAKASSSINAGLTHDIAFTVIKAGPAVAEIVVATATFSTGVELDGACAIAGQSVTHTVRPSPLDPLQGGLRHVTFGARAATSLLPHRYSELPPSPAIRPLPTSLLERRVEAHIQAGENQLLMRGRGKELGHV